MRLVLNPCCWHVHSMLPMCLDLLPFSNITLEVTKVALQGIGHVQSRNHSEVLWSPWDHRDGNQEPGPAERIAKQQLSSTTSIYTSTLLEICNEKESWRRGWSGPKCAFIFDKKILTTVLVVFSVEGQFQVIVEPSLLSLQSYLT